MCGPTAGRLSSSPSLSGRCSVSEWSVRERVASPPSLSPSLFWPYEYEVTKVAATASTGAAPSVGRRFELFALPLPLARPSSQTHARELADRRERPLYPLSRSVGRSVRHAPRPADAPRAPTMNVIQRIKNLQDLDPVHGEVNSGGQG